MWKVSVIWFYNNLKGRGDCQNTRKPHKTSHFVGWVVGWQQLRLSARTQECFTMSSFPSSRFLACEDWIYELRPIDVGVASVERYRTRSEHSGKRVLSKIRRRDAQPT